MLAQALTLTGSKANAETKILNYKFNQNVVISISNTSCPLKALVAEYPYAAIASRIDNQYLFGCYKKLDEDNIEIQWAKGDKSVLPANAFLVDPNGVRVVPEPVPTL
jgi:hypothetical protein